MAPPAALLIGEITHARSEWEELSSFLTLKEFPSGGREKFLANCENGMYDDVVAIYRSNASNKHTGPFDKNLISALPKSIKFICHNGAGYDNIDIPSATIAGLSVSSTPVAPNNATADIAMFLIIGALRQANMAIAAIRGGEWQGKTGLGHDPNQKVLGILGMGGIGQALAHRAKSFGMTIQYHNRNPLPPELEDGAKYVSFDELLASSDIFSLNLALNPTTKHIIGEKELAKMKNSVIVINTARGPLIDENALVAALDSGKIASVGLDVFESEPKVAPGLLNNPKVMLLPHIGTMTFETQKGMEMLALRNLVKAVEEGELITQVQEQKKK